MRKQTKLVAVLSTAALLAIGASMTSFAAQGWAEEDGTWVYYDKNGDKVTDSWKKSGDSWYWLDENGEMAVDMLVEDDDNYYYVNENGTMVTNQWVAVENEDAGEDDEPDHYWYYFQANGKAYRRSDTSSTISAKTINGKKYAFDTDGKMLYGWVNDSFERVTDEDTEWQEGLYYFGGEDDGAMRVNTWELISITSDEEADEIQPGDEFWDEDQDRWFFFQSSGKKKYADGDKVFTDKKINGKKYGFDKYGRMVASWYSEDLQKASGSITTVASDSQGNPDYSHSFMYFSNPEDGARYSKGWFKVVPGYYLHESKYEDDADYWYYANGDGNIIANRVKKIKGKTYAFDEYGRMISGLALLKYTDSSDSDGTEIVKYADDDKQYSYDTEDAFNETAMGDLAEDLANGTFRFMYFGGADDGSMKTGRQNIDIDGETFAFKFATKSNIKGAGLTGVDDDKFYVGGKLVKADKDDKYQIVKFTKYADADGVKENAWVVVDDDVKISELLGKTDSDRESIKDATFWDLSKAKGMDVYRVVNTSGKIVEGNGKSVKNGDDYKIKVNKDGVIQSITLED